MIHDVIGFLQSNLPKEVFVFIVAMLPIVELRGAIPLGIAMQMPWFEVALLSVLGNLVPVPFLMWLVRPVFNWMRGTKLFKKLIEKQEAKLQKHSDKLMKYTALGLLIFVAVPFPGTGAWTGAMLADFINLRFKYAFPAIVGGVVVAGVVVTLISLGFANGFSWLVG